MNESIRVQHCRQYCTRCNQLIFEYYASPDGHFGLANFAEGAQSEGSHGGRKVRCGKCGARYRLLERLNGMGEPAERI
ncbi:MAG TPA: hypothetical protein VMV34_05135 [Terriglobia bacterium]|nr:hypothetical protein [Terriglobia bacterium]